MSHPKHNKLTHHDLARIEEGVAKLHKGMGWESAEKALGLQELHGRFGMTHSARTGEYLYYFYNFNPDHHLVMIRNMVKDTLKAFELVGAGWSDEVRNKSKGSGINS